MKKVIAFIIVLTISNMVFAQQSFTSDTTQNSPVNKKSPKIRYQGIIETGYSWGVGEWGKSVFRLNVINGISLPNYSLGIGTGISSRVNDTWGSDNYNIDSSMHFNFLVPFYLDNRIYFPNKKIRPYLAFGLGFAFIEYTTIGFFNYGFYKNLFLNSSIGIFWKISERVSLITGIVYESYNIDYEIRITYPYPYYYSYSRYFTERSRSLGFNFGISF